MRSLLLLLVPLAIVLAAPAQAQTVVTGTILDDGGEPLPYATILVAGTTDGTATGGDGRFSFTTTAEGRRQLVARYVGYAPATRRVTLAGDTVRVSIQLRESLLNLDGAVVTADALAGTSEAGTGLTALDAVTTPGASGDLLQAVQTLSGLTQVDEGAGLFVRGGDVSETRILLDGLPLLQPYAFETPIGGTFGTVSPFLIRGTAFSTGGFSARYGNALSAVLSLDSQDEPTKSQQTISLGLAAGSLGADIPVGRGGIRLAANQSFTDALFWVNGNGEDFAQNPQSTNASVSGTWPLGSGRVKVLAMGNRDEVGVRLNDPSFTGVLTSVSGSGLGLVQWRGAIGEWQASATAGGSGYGSEQVIGSLAIRPGETAYSTRVEGQRATGESLRWTVGAEGQRLGSQYEGSYSPDGVLDPDAETVTFDYRESALRGGAWLEAEAQLSRRVVARAGLRADGASDIGRVTLDPRLNVTVALSSSTQLRLAGGLYSQRPAVETVALADRQLAPSRASHWVAGVLHESAGWTLRAEAYRKDYRDLVVERDGAVRSADGQGRAQGLDLFARLADSPDRRWHGWVSYSLLSSERTQARRLGDAVVLDRGPAPFDIRHALNVVGKAEVANRLVAGGRFRVSSGRPVTPVTGAVAPEGYWLPIEGRVGTDRLPAYIRLDANLSYTLPVPGLGAVVVYGAVNNLLNRGNVVGRLYSPDYSAFEPDVTAYRRSVYAGVSLLLR